MNQLYHIPPEENLQIDIFNQALKSINRNKPCFIELGSGGTDASYYSILCENYFPDSVIINTEPRLNLLENIKVLWKDKYLQNAILYHCYHGEILCPEYNIPDSTPKKDLSEIITENNLTSVDILHIDIQGAETLVLLDLRINNLLNMIRYYFVNIHVINGENTLSKCKQILQNELKNIKIHFENSQIGGHGDGLLVIENLNYEPI